MPALELDNVSKRFGRRSAVEKLRLQAEAGEVLGFLGPNGAGKTTTIRLLTGFLRPSSGTVRLLGYDMQRPHEANQARRRLGYVPDVAGLEPQVEGQQLLDELAALQGRPPIDREHVRAALELARDDLRRPLGALSRGTRQKINLLQGLQHRPDLLILDEPTEGLDPLGKAALFGLLREAHGRGATVFFSSHILGEVEELCDRVALIRGGQLLAVDSLAVLRRNLRRQVTLRLAADAPADAWTRLAGLAGVADLEREGDTLRFAAAELEPLLRLLAELPVQDLAITPPSLADVFVRLYRDGGGATL